MLKGILLQKEFIKIYTAFFYTTSTGTNTLMKKVILFIIYCIQVNYLFAQFTGQIPQAKKYKFQEVYDSTYGINIYEKLNFGLGGDSIRNDKKGYACQGWVEDY